MGTPSANFLNVASAASIPAGSQALLSQKLPFTPMGHDFQKQYTSVTLKVH